MNAAINTAVSAAAAGGSSAQLSQAGMEAGLPIMESSFFQSGMLGGVLVLLFSAPVIAYSFLIRRQARKNACSGSFGWVTTTGVSTAVFAATMLALPIGSMAMGRKGLGLLHSIPTTLSLPVLGALTLVLTGLYWNVCNRCADKEKCNHSAYVASIIITILGALAALPLVGLGIPLLFGYNAAISCGQFPEACKTAAQVAVAAA